MSGEVQRAVLTGEAGALAVCDWPLPAGATRATVLIVHGLGEHVGRYHALALQLRSWGFAVRGYDHQGHGHSEGARGSLHSDDGLLHDLGTVIDATRAHPVLGRGPLILLGHSLGGLASASAVAQGLRPVDGLVLSSPALGAWMNPLQKLLLATVPRWLPDLRVGNGLNPNFVARDPAAVAAYRADPLVHDRISARLGGWIARTGPATLALAAQWTVPSLLVYAGQDRLVRPDACAAFARQAPAACMQAQCFEAMYHEVFNDPERGLVFDALRRWLDARWPL
jgi:alpha-beta hydrolase superfamily lysophospholipase